MTLENYLKERKISTAEFSHESGIPYATLYSYLGGRRKPAVDICYMISKVTSGLVTPFDFISDAEKKALDARIKTVSKQINQRN